MDTNKTLLGYGRYQLSDEVAGYIRELILTGQLREGEFVRLERIASELGVSSTPVREGLLALRSEGFVSLEPRRGFQVKSISAEDIRDIFFVQSQLAGELAARATRKISTEDLETLEQWQTAINEASLAGDSTRVEELNNQFHSKLYKIAQSEKLTWFLSLSLQYVPRRFASTIPGWTDATINEHTDILEALRQRNSEGARKAMTEHIVHAGELLVSHLASMKSPPANGESEPIRMHHIS